MPMAEMEEGEEEDDRRGTPENDMGERSGMGPPSTPAFQGRGEGTWGTAVKRTSRFPWGPGAAVLLTVLPSAEFSNSFIRVLGSCPPEVAGAMPP